MLRKQKPSKRNYRCYCKFVGNNHPKSERISFQRMVCLWNFMEHRSLYSTCTVLSFMQYMYIIGCLCSGLCAALNALSNIVTMKGSRTLSEHPFTSCDLEIIYNRQQPLRRYTSIWDISLALDYYNSIEMHSKLQLKDLVKTTVMSLMISSACRKQALFTLTVHNIVTEKNKTVFLPNKTFYDSNTHTPLAPLMYINISKIPF